jgi:hypothetical protein
MDGRREDSLPQKTPNANFEVRALDDTGKSCVILYSEFGTPVPQEGDIRDFLEGNTIKKKKYTSGAWVDTGIEWEI